jgi:hypothetical protein
MNDFSSDESPYRDLLGTQELSSMEVENLQSNDTLKGSARAAYRSTSDLSEIMFLVRSFDWVPYIGPALCPSRVFARSSHWLLLAHAYAACGAALLSVQDPRWTQVSLRHYSQALRTLATSLPCADGTHREECILAVINALHIFEVSEFMIADLQTLTDQTLRHDVHLPNITHLLAGRQLYLKYVEEGLPKTQTQRLLLEEFTFQLSVSSTFISRIFVDEPLTMMSAAS